MQSDTFTHILMLCCSILLIVNGMLSFASSGPAILMSSLFIIIGLGLLLVSLRLIIQHHAHKQ
ncbi:hypothetical protein ACSBRB_06215 [Staphylococcus auricularis]|uniref:hypothetical protein n=1 Tax=Staphylococcus auricularis TaxID=29379 RepID=UPI003EBF4E3B